VLALGFDLLDDDLLMLAGALMMDVFDDTINGWNLLVFI